MVMMTAGCRRFVSAATCGMATLTIAGCGGGGNGSGGGGPAPVNTPPAFTSSASASVAENTVSAGYTAAATNAQGSPITFTISGGADAARFNITTAGALSFISAPNFELPTDVDRDNVYQVSVMASDGSASSALDLSITVTNSKEGIQVRRIATGFGYPVGLGSIPGDSHLIIASGSVLFDFDPATGNRTQIAGFLCSGSLAGQGLRAMVVGQRNFADNRPNVFVMCQSPTRQFTVANYDLSADRSTVFNQSNVLNVELPAELSAGGAMAFSPSDRMLFVAMPDGSDRTNPPKANAQDPASQLGKLFRIQQNANGGAPLWIISQVGSGVHAPTGATLFGNTVLFGDRGLQQREEVDLLDRSAPGVNFGWPFKEGRNADHWWQSSGGTD